MVLLNDISRIPCHKISKSCIPFIMTIPSTCITSLFLQNRESQSSNKTNPASRSIGHPQLTEKLLLLEGRRGGVCSLLLVCFLRRGGRLYAKARFDMNLCSFQVCSCWRSPSITAHNNICRGSKTRPGSHSDGKTHKAAGRFCCTYVDNSIQVCKTGKYIIIVNLDRYTFLGKCCSVLWGPSHYSEMESL